MEQIAIKHDETETSFVPLYFSHLFRFGLKFCFVSLSFIPILSILYADMECKFQYGDSSNKLDKRNTLSESEKTHFLFDFGLYLVIHKGDLHRTRGKYLLLY